MGSCCTTTGALRWRRSCGPPGAERDAEIRCLADTHMPGTYEMDEASVAACQDTGSQSNDELFGPLSNTSNLSEYAALNGATIEAKFLQMQPAAKGRRVLPSQRPVGPRPLLCRLCKTRGPAPPALNRALALLECLRRRQLLCRQYGQNAGRLTL